MSIKKDFGARNRKPDITNLVYGKVPPQAPDMEVAILGAIMLEKGAFTIVLGIIQSAEVFYLDAHQKIYEAMLRLETKGADIDLLTVTEELRKTEDLEIVGGAYYVSKLTMSVVTAAHIETHCYVVMEKFIQRELIRISGQILGDAYSDSTDVHDLLATAQKELYAIANHVSTKEPKPLSSMMKDVISESEAQKHANSLITGVPTQFTAIDSKTSGWQRTDFIVLAARPGVGKTAFALNMAKGMALSGYAGAFFSLEMGGNQLIQRLAANHMSIQMDKIKNAAKMDQAEWDRYMAEAGKMSQLPIYIDDDASQTVMQIRGKIFKLLNKGVKIRWVIIDYLGLIQPGNNERGQNRTAQMTGVSRDLKILAKDANLPIIALSQLNREGDTKPSLTTLRDTGAIEQDADIIGFLYNGTDADTKNDTVFDIQKHRNGSVGITLLNFEKDIQRFTEKGSTGYVPKGFIPMQEAEKRFANNDLPF